MSSHACWTVQVKGRPGSHLGASRRSVTFRSFPTPFSNKTPSLNTPRSPSCARFHLDRDQTRAVQFILATADKSGLACGFERAPFFTLHLTLGSLR